MRLGSETRLGDDYVVWLKIRDHGTEQYAGTYEKRGYCSNELADRTVDFVSEVFQREKIEIQV
jgi:hypothetical protein